MDLPELKIGYSYRLNDVVAYNINGDMITAIPLDNTSFHAYITSGINSDVIIIEKTVTDFRKYDTYGISFTTPPGETKCEFDIIFIDTSAITIPGQYWLKVDWIDINGKQPFISQQINVVK